MKSHRLLKHVRAGGLLVTGLILLMPSAGEAQTSFACYVPNLGVVYRIRDGGSLPDDCRDPSHVEFSWTALSDGSVTTNLLVDGAVTTAKLANGSVNNTKLTGNAVNGANIVDASVTASDLASSVLAGIGHFAFNNIGTASGVSTSVQNLGSVSINAPRAGNVILMITGYGVFFADNTVLQVRLGTTAGGAEISNTQIGRLDGAATDRYELGFSDLAVIPVTAGARSFFASAVLPGVFSAANVNMVNVKLVALFIPTL